MSTDAGERRPWLLDASTWPDVRDGGREVAVLPWGATEPHNLHLPYGTDTFQVTEIAERAGARAWRAGASVLVLPTVPFGVQTGQLDLAFALNLNPSSQAALLGDIARTVAAHGVGKLVVLNGHGGNSFTSIIRELQPAVGTFLCTVDWYRSVDATEYFDAPGDHAGELETSVMMEVRPDLVRPLTDAGPGNARAWRIRALREGWAWAPRPWSRVTDDTGVGDPSASTREKGARYVEAVVERLADFLVELAATDVDDLVEGA